MRITKAVYRLSWLLAIAACAQTENPVSGGSESHFLACEEDTECDELGSDFQCVSGRCRDQSESVDGDVELDGSGGMSSNNQGGSAAASAGAGGAAGGEEPDAQAGSGGASTTAITPGGNCGGPDAFEPLVPRDDEICYELIAHDDGAALVPFLVPTDESISQIYYDIPWAADSVATRFGADFDNLEVIRQWLLFSTNTVEYDVQHNVTGTTLGEEAKVLAGWNVGGCNLSLPSDVGLELPNPSSGKKLMVQWHHYNVTGAPQPDASQVHVCVVPRSTRPYIAGLTVLGTENLGGGGGMPPSTENRFTGACLNGTTEPITIVAFRPSMRELGTNMYSEIARLGGNTEAVFDQPFVFDNQVHYLMDPRVVLQAGEKIRSECTFFNNTSANVGFGVSASSETCAQYVISYPAGALDKPENTTLIGSLNTCWGDD